MTAPSITWPEADPASPFFCHGPTLVSFSGGRTSAYMLWRILCAHGGVLPDYVYVCFANTGREHWKTLRFVHEVGTRWKVRIIWLEWRPGWAKVKVVYPETLKLVRHLDTEERAQRVAARRQLRDIALASSRFEIVGFNSADRDGKWFAELIRRKQVLPNMDMRYCTEKLKIDTMKHFMMTTGLPTWFNMVGLRADEPSRVVKQVIRNGQRRDRWVSGSPLFVAGVIERVVLWFWLGANRDPENLTHPLPQGFDVGIRSLWGNCLDCFLKSRGKRAQIYREDPSVADWSIEQERLASERTSIRRGYMARFDKDEAVAQLVHAVQTSPELIDWNEGADKEIDCTGDTCTIDEGMTDADFVGPEAAATIAWLKRQMVNTLAMPRGVPAQPAAMNDLFERIAT